MYPIIFNNIYHSKIWGGQGLRKFRTNIPDGNIGESWDISCHENGIGIINNGVLKGMPFDKAINQFGTNLLGNKISNKKFPLLVKLISASENLSIQVHPNDEFAKREENELGKTEAWYVIDAEDGATLKIGTKNCDKETFKKAIEENTLEKFINKVPVKKGDFFYIESGMVHGIDGGVTLVEVQQNSDVTYRVYDYNRGREIHVDKALEVINFDLKIEEVQETCSNDEFNKTTLCSKEFFIIEKYDIKTSIKESSDKDRFFLFTCVEGSGKIITNDYSVEFKMGDSVFIPAYLGEYTIDGGCTLLKSYVPIS